MELFHVFRAGLLPGNTKNIPFRGRLDEFLVVPTLRRAQATIELLPFLKSEHIELLFGVGVIARLLAERAAAKIIKAHNADNPNSRAALRSNMTTPK